MRGRPGRSWCPVQHYYFNPRPHAGATTGMSAPLLARVFQSTPPCGGDLPWVILSKRFSNFNPRPHAGATRTTGKRRMRPAISIHAPMRGRRFDFSQPHLYYKTISIHAPMRGRHVTDPDVPGSGQFQSTPPCGGDNGWENSSSRRLNFNPRPHAGATGMIPEFKGRRAISIHAPMRGRPKLYGAVFIVVEFQSTPPCGGDLAQVPDFFHPTISIHAPMRGRH